MSILSVVVLGQLDLHRYGWRLANCPERQRLRHAARCAESLGRLLGRMHAAGIANRDLKGANVLIVERGDRPATYLIDPDGVIRDVWEKVKVNGHADAVKCQLQDYH